VLVSFEVFLSFRSFFLFSFLSFFLLSFFLFFFLFFFPFERCLRSRVITPK